MENIIISSDSTCDLYADYVLEHGIRIVPLHYTMEENGQLTEGVDSFTEYAQYVGFYNKLRAGGFSRTSMLNFDSHYAHFKKLAEEGAEKILHYSLSGGLSPTANVAKEAASAVMEKYPNCKIIAIDSLAATIGQGALVREAVRLRAEGVAIIANDLYYLKRGGRVSSVAAAAGTLLNIKPVLSFTNDGKLTVVEKVRGMKKAFAYALAKTEKFKPVEENRMMRIVHTDAEKDAEELADMVEKRWGYRPEISIMGPVIGSHVGPGSVSMIWLTKELRQD